MTQSNREIRVECRAAEPFARWLAELPGSLVISTYQANKLALLGWRDRQPSLLMRQFPKPMGIAVQSERLALVTRHEITLFANAPVLASSFVPQHSAPQQSTQYDALYLPRATYYTGDINGHDLAWAGSELWVVNSRFSCLARLSTEYSFLPEWKPPFISAIVPEDRCHLNGLAIVEGRPKYVTAHGVADSVGGWREQKASGGIVIDVDSNEILARGLAMPHSPRWHDGALWVLNSGAGELLRIQPQSGEVQVVCVLPAYLRGLCLIGQFAVIGLSQIRERHIFGGLPVQNRFQKLLCGVAVVDLRSGIQMGLFEFTSGCSEVYDVQFLPKVRAGNILNGATDAAREGFTAPEFAYWLRPDNEIQDR